MKRTRRSYFSSLKPRSLKLPSSFLDQLPRANISARRASSSHKNFTALPETGEHAEPLPTWTRLLLSLEQGRVIEIGERECTGVDCGDARDVPMRHLNLTLKGEPVIWIEEWVAMGLCQSVTDVILLGIRVLRTIEQTLKSQPSELEGELEARLMTERKSGGA